MRALLDSHLVYWSLAEDPKLSTRAREVIEDPENELYVSVATIWELGIKSAIGRLDIQGDLRDSIAAASLDVLQITADHAVASAKLPYHHKDPFDRMLVAQAMVEDMVLLTVDRRLSLYGASVLLV